VLAVFIMGQPNLSLVNHDDESIGRTYRRPPKYWTFGHRIKRPLFYRPLQRYKTMPVRLTSLRSTTLRSLTLSDDFTQNSSSSPSGGAKAEIVDFGRAYSMLEEETWRVTRGSHLYFFHD
jgi:hypothetical protein